MTTIGVRRGRKECLQSPINIDAACSLHAQYIRLLQKKGFFGVVLHCHKKTRWVKIVTD